MLRLAGLLFGLALALAPLSARAQAPLTEAIDKGRLAWEARDFLRCWLVDRDTGRLAGWFAPDFVLGECSVPAEYQGLRLSREKYIEIALYYLGEMQKLQRKDGRDLPHFIRPTETAETHQFQVVETALPVEIYYPRANLSIETVRLCPGDDREWFRRPFQAPNIVYMSFYFRDYQEIGLGLVFAWQLQQGRWRLLSFGPLPK